MNVLQSANRVLIFVITELLTVLRRPSAFLSLILGPFFILAIFGVGLVGIRPPLRAIIVVPPGSGLPTDIQTYQTSVGGLKVEEVTQDPKPAEQLLRSHAVDTVIIFPADLQKTVQAGRQATITVEVSVANPTDVVYVNTMADELAARTNQTIIARLVEAGEKQAPPGTSTIPPSVAAAPTRAQVRNLAPITPGVVPFFGPAVLILVLQHLCITLVALSLLAERKSGIFELFRVGPTNAWEIIAGKLIAFIVIGAVIAAASLALLALGLHVPFLGNLPDLITIVAFVLVASIGVGLLLGALADSERMALQASLLLLLASIFFSGFILELGLFSPPVQVMAQLLPATGGIALLQSELLFGTLGNLTLLLVLAGIGVVALVAAWALLRRSMTATG